MKSNNKKELKEAPLGKGILYVSNTRGSNRGIIKWDY